MLDLRVAQLRAGSAGGAWNGAGGGGQRLGARPRAKQPAERRALLQGQQERERASAQGAEEVAAPQAGLR